MIEEKLETIRDSILDMKINLGVSSDAPLEDLVTKTEGAVVPTGTTNITENGIYDVTNFASANVNVSGGGSSQEDGIIERTISGLYTNNRVSKIGNYVFQNCTSLTTVSFPSCTSLGNNAFQNCTSLTAVSFPACTSIDNNAFNSCTSLTAVSFPACTNIGNNAFSDCYNLLSLYLLGNSVPRLSNINAFNSTPISNYTTSTGGVYGSIIVQPSMIEAFKTATNWSVYSSRFSAWNGID